jgi:GDP-L-fucose synthase
MLALQAKLYNERKNSKTKMLCVIPTNIHGPHDNFNLEDSHVIPGLIHRYLFIADLEMSLRITHEGIELNDIIYKSLYIVIKLISLI